YQGVVEMKSINNSTIPVTPEFLSQLETMRSHEQRIQESEASNILDVALAGRCLSVMRDELKMQGPNWEKRLARETGLSENEARRRITIGSQWGDWIETPEARAVLPLLPGDTQKLESICRIPKTQLPAFLSKHDCRRLDRESVRKAVQAHLGVANV